MRSTECHSDCDCIIPKRLILTTDRKNLRCFPCWRLPSGAFNCSTVFNLHTWQKHTGQLSNDRKDCPSDFIFVTFGCYRYRYKYFIMFLNTIAQNLSLMSPLSDSTEPRAPLSYKLWPNHRYRYLYIQHVRDLNSQSFSWSPNQTSHSPKKITL